MSLWIDLFGIACLSILFSTLGNYLLIKPKLVTTDSPRSVDSIIGIGLGVGLYVELYTALLPHVKAMRVR